MTIPHGRYLPGFLCICALFAVSCGAESGTDSLPDNVTEISTELAKRTTTETTTTMAATTESASISESSVVTTTSPETTSMSATTVKTTASETVTVSSESSSTVTSMSVYYTLPEMSWWTPLPVTSTTTITTTTLSGVTVTAPEAWATTAAQTVAQTGSYALSASDQKFLESCVFVGDSICSGLRVYKILPASHVVAKGSVGVRNIFNFKFQVGKYETDVISALKSLNPKRVIFSMGMNDINMSSTKQYCTNYQNLLTEAQKALPNAQLYAASITPIAANISFSTNAKIDKYNSALQSFLTKYPGWKYLDITKELKNQWNALKNDFSGGDGIHLSPAAYQAYLWQVCKQLNT